MDSAGIYVAVAVILLFLSYLLKVTTETRSDVRALNGRLTGTEVGLAAHGKLSDEREHHTDRRLIVLEGKK